jgi:transcription termination/antitermination protein NusG
MAETLRADAAAEPEIAANSQRWYACYTRSRHEKQVERLLRERSFETFLPLVPRVSIWKDRRKTVAWPLFPSYVFSRFALGQVYRVLGTPGVATIVKTDGRPVAIADDELENVRLFAQVLAGGTIQPETRPFLAKGEWVEVLSGPLAGVRGIVVEQRNCRRVVIGLAAIGQGLEVDVEAATLRPISAP